MKDPNIHDELKNIAPELNKMKSAKGFSVPPVYFKELQGKVLSQIENEQQKESFGTWLRNFLNSYFQPRYALALATVTIIIVAAINFRGSENDMSALTNITVDDAYEYVQNHISEYNTEDLLALADEGYEEYDVGTFSEEELNIAIDVLIEDIDAESLEELF